MESTLKRTWAEIDLDALAHNYHTLRRHIGGGVKFLGVVKADAYGHGAVEVSRLLQELGADYLAVSSVDEAMELRRNRITPILAARDPNVTPALLKRKFGRGVRVEHPALAVRLALSEQEGGRPRALLLREGLLPYAETVVGSRRLRQGVQWATAVSLLGSAAGMLLAYYLCSVGALSMMPPLTLLVFQLLWVVPVALLADWTARY